MNKVIVPILQYVINISKKSRFIQNLFEAPFDLNEYPEMGDFVDQFGNKHILLDGLRSKIKPGWENMFKDVKLDVNAKLLAQLKQNGKIAVDGILPFISSYNKEIKGSNILEVGCNTGATAFTLAELGANSVTGSEFSGYKVDSVNSDDEVFEEKLEEVNDNLLNIRTELSREFTQSDKVKFVDDDICNSKLKENSFDIIFSWEVLEHIHDTEKAFESMGKLLKKDGVMVHLYNPFYCLNGGHSLCTLDFLWGHARLSDQDYVKYIEKFRPSEKEASVSFHQNGLNRMSLKDLSSQLERTNFDIKTILPFTKEQHGRMVNSRILEDVQKLYPTVTYLDLIAPRVIVVAQQK